MHPPVPCLSPASGTSTASGATASLRGATVSDATVPDATVRATGPDATRGTVPDASSRATVPDASRAPVPDATQASAVVRWRRALAALARVVAAPERTDQVLEFSIHANAGSMPRRIERFFTSPSGRRLHAEHRTIDSSTVDLDALGALPVDTLGYAYATFLRTRGLTPAVFDAAPAELHDPRMAYVVQRLRQTHDLWHVVTGQDTDPASEVVLQAFTFAQVRAPSSLILATLGTLRAARARPGLARDVLAAFRVGLRAEKLAVFAWEDHWTTPLDEVRAMLNLPAPPRAAA